MLDAAFSEPVRGGGNPADVGKTPGQHVVADAWSGEDVVIELFKINILRIFWFEGARIPLEICKPVFNVLVLMS